MSAVPGNAMKNALSQGVTKIGNAAINAANDKLPLIVVVSITVLLFVAVILYITFAMKGSNLKGKALTTLPIRLEKLESPIEITSSDIPKPVVGREYTYSFWLYLDSFEQEYDNVNKRPVHKLVFYRGNPGDATTANPLVMVDGQSNKLYIVIKTAGSSLSASFNKNVNTDLHEILANNYFLTDKQLTDPVVNKHIVMGIDYVPLQRWVHVGVVIDNKLVTVFLDGEIYSVKSVDEFKASRQPAKDRLGRTIDYNLILDKTEGNIFIGRGLVGNKRAPNGFLGNLSFYNYALTSDDIKAVYNRGPIKGNTVMSMFGMNQYGVRSPIYKMDQYVQ